MKSLHLLQNKIVLTLANRCSLSLRTTFYTNVHSLLPFYFFFYLPLTCIYLHHTYLFFILFSIDLDLGTDEIRMKCFAKWINHKYLCDCDKRRNNNPVEASEQSTMEWEIDKLKKKADWLMFVFPISNGNFQWIFFFWCSMATMFWQLYIYTFVIKR